MNQAEGIRRVGFNDGVTQGPAGIGGKIRRRPENHVFAGFRMLERKFRRVQADARERRAAVQRVAENWETTLRRVNADLMRAPRERLGLHHWVGADVRRL